MSLWKITDKGPIKLGETKFKKENMLEEHLENWIEKDSSILGEPLLIFGRQVTIPDTKDRLDLLAVDVHGVIVVIELKRGQLKDPVDVQSLRYASYLSKWRFSDFENIAKNYYGKTGDPEFNFNDIFETFCNDSGIDDIPDFNNEQRIIIAGSSVREKLGSVALWLRDHNIDIKLIEVKSYKEGNNIFIEPTTLVPLPVSKFVEVGKPSTEGNPWIIDGKKWHLEQRCSPKTKEMLLILDQVLQDEFDLEGSRWSQKYYVAYPINNYYWLVVHTKPKFLVLDFIVEASSFNTEKLAKRLSLEIFDSDESLSDKLTLPSSVFIKNRNPSSDKIKIRIKEEFNMKSETFINFLHDAYKAFPK